MVDAPLHLTCGYKVNHPWDPRIALCAKPIFYVAFALWHPCLAIIYTCQALMHAFRWKKVTPGAPDVRTTAPTSAVAGAIFAPSITPLFPPPALRNGGHSPATIPTMHTSTPVSSAQSESFHDSLSAEGGTIALHPPSSVASATTPTLSPVAAEQPTPPPPLTPHPLALSSEQQTKLQRIRDAMAYSMCDDSSPSAAPQNETRQFCQNLIAALEHFDSLPQLTQQLNRAIDQPQSRLEIQVVQALIAQCKSMEHICKNMDVPMQHIIQACQTEDPAIRDMVVQQLGAMFNAVDVATVKSKLSARKTEIDTSVQTILRLYRQMRRIYWQDLQQATAAARRPTSDTMTKSLAAAVARCTPRPGERLAITLESPVASPPVSSDSEPE